MILYTNYVNRITLSSLIIIILLVLSTRILFIRNMIRPAAIMSSVVLLGGCLVVILYNEHSSLDSSDIYRDEQNIVCLYPVDDVSHMFVSILRLEIPG